MAFIGSPRATIMPYAGRCRRSAALLAALLLATAFDPCTQAYAQTASVARQPPASTPLGIVPLTTVRPDGVGYLADPQPVRLAPSSDARVQILSGTTKAIISGTYPVIPGAFTWAPLTVNADPLAPALRAAGATITNFQNVDIFQADDGSWHAAVTIGLATAEHPAHWTVVAHAHPVGDAASGTAPRAWSADTLLAGTFSDPMRGNYDGKFEEIEGRLYMLYVKTLTPSPAVRNGIVLQAMRTPMQPDAAPPTVLLTPGDRDGPLESEWYGTTEAKLVEAPYLSRIGGKYALVYSTGAYLTPGYKAAVAWSDRLLPPAGGRYRKVLLPDPKGIWGVPNRREVRYLVQSQSPSWPNFTGRSVIGPGVAAAVQNPAGDWWLYFNGFAPGDMPDGPRGKVDGTHRRPFALRLHAAVPPNASVAQASDAQLGEWLQPDVH